MAIGAAAVKAAGTDKPEYVSRDEERCPKCQTKEINQAHLESEKGIIETTLLMCAMWAGLE